MTAENIEAANEFIKESLREETLILFHQDSLYFPLSGQITKVPFGTRGEVPGLGNRYVVGRRDVISNFDRGITNRCFRFGDNLDRDGRESLVLQNDRIRCMEFDRHLGPCDGREEQGDHYFQPNRCPSGFYGLHFDSGVFGSTD